MIQHQTSNSCGNYNYNAFLYSDISYSAHFHKNYELIYVLKGTVELSVNGKPDVLKPGEMILISPYAVHSFAVDGKSKIWVGVFSEILMQFNRELFQFVQLLQHFRRGIVPHLMRPRGKPLLWGTSQEKNVTILAMCSVMIREKI
jgi:hypothetical protein